MDIPKPIDWEMMVGALVIKMAKKRPDSDCARIVKMIEQVYEEVENESKTKE